MKSHTIVLPIRHITTLSELKPEESLSLHRIISDVTNKMDRTLGCSSMVILNGEKHRTQTHLHYHVLPVFDGLRTIISKYLEVSAKEFGSKKDLEKMAKKLRQTNNQHL